MPEHLKARNTQCHTRMPEHLKVNKHNVIYCANLQDKPGSLLGVATSAADARVMLEALEAGTAGAVLRTSDPLQVCTLTFSLCSMFLE